MKIYDFENIKKFIEDNKDNIAEVDLGMQEDWYWTAETVFVDGEYITTITDETTIGGINGSSWATPEMRVTYKDGSTLEVEFSKEEPTKNLK